MTEIRAVLVDDDPEWGETTARLLDHKRENFEVEFTKSVEGATEMVKGDESDEPAVDCVIADYHMPGLDGIDLLEIVREEYPDLPFVLVTAKGSEDVASEAISKEVTDYITKKPGEDQTETIANRVENAVRSYRAEKRVEELNRKIDELHENASRIGETETRKGVYEEVADAGVSVVGFDGAVALERNDSGFVVRAWSGDLIGAHEDGEVFGQMEDKVEERAYSSGRSVVTEATEAASVTSSEMAEAMATPLGEYGVLVSVSDGFGENDLQLAETLAEHATASLRRVESRERIVEERDGKETMRSLLTNSSSRGEVEEAVTEYLVKEEGYALAWVGDVSDGISPRAFAREEDTEEGYLESIIYTAEARDDSEVHEPGVRAAVTGEPQVVGDVDDADGEWSSEAAENGYGSAVALPLQHEGVLYGALAVYSPSLDGFGERERNRVEEFAESLSSAIKSTTIREGLTTDRPMGLEMQVGDHPLTSVSKAWETTVVVNSAIRREDDVLYQTKVRDGVPDFLSEEESEFPEGVEGAQLIDETQEGARIRVFVRGATPELTLADYGGMIERTTVDDTATVRAKLPRSVDVSEVADAVKKEFSGARVTAKTSSASTSDEEPLSEDLRIWQLLNEELTQKQFDALRTAYRNGYFERPRKTNATETAEIMGVSRPTFVQHLRVAEKKILDHMIEAR